MGNKWISVKDRLPENGQEYIVFGCGEVTTMDFIGNNWVSDIIGVVAENKITHWMPLPEPPKEK